jgi:hypothetical protein
VFGHVTLCFETASQCRRQLGVNEEAHLRAPQDWVIVLARGKLQYRRDVVTLEIGVVREDFFSRRARGQEI